MVPVTAKLMVSRLLAFASASRNDLGSAVVCIGDSYDSCVRLHCRRCKQKHGKEEYCCSAHCIVPVTLHLTIIGKTLQNVQSRFRTTQRTRLFPSKRSCQLEKSLVVSGLKIGSSGRIRTYDQSVNSRPLYH